MATPEEAVALAEAVAKSPGLTFAGLMTYPPPNGTANVQAFMARAKALLEAKNIPVPVITSGGCVYRKLDSAILVVKAAENGV